MMSRWIGLLLVIGAFLSAVGECWNLTLPTVSWGFSLSRAVPAFHQTENISWYEELMPRSVELLPWFGWLFAALILLFGLFLFLRSFRKDAVNPMAVRKIQRFKNIKRGYYSFLILVGLTVIAGLDQLIVGKEALIVRHEGKNYYPAFTRDIETGADFGEEGDAGLKPADYRELKKKFAEQDGWVLMPLWPYAPTNDNIPALSKSLEEEDGLLVGGNGKPYSGLGTRLFDPEKPDLAHIRLKFRKGLPEGKAYGWDRDRNRVYGVVYENGKVVEGTEVWEGEGELDDYLAQSSSEFYDVSFPSSDPTWAESPRHFLGTTSQGYDVISYLYGGLQVNIQAALIYIPVVYFIGVTIGLLMGYFGGTFDLVVQRLIEILSNIPFLFLVIVVSSAVPATYKDRFGIYVILGILAVFGWMGMTYLMRTAALKEKARDYIAASRVIGASTPRILFRHLLPNSVAIVVTLIPFSISGLILSLASLDYLGFGLPEKYATWGKLLQEGLTNLSSPWLVTSAFTALVTLLVLITFVGEAIREAYDPKKYTYYR